jgi:Gas vesicle synthesis protein GvpL/GvpF
VARDRAADDLTRWAAQQAPELLARARAEAVAILRDALVEAALAERRSHAPSAEPAAAAQVTPSAQPEPSPRPDEGELIWVYCVLGASAPQPDDLPGIDERFPVERVEAAGLAALLSRVPRSEFAAEPLRENLNRLDWLERVARAHEAILEAVLARATIVPLRLCTLYETEDGVRRMLQQEQRTLSDALDALVGRDEWGVKLFVDGDKLEDEARATSDEAARLTRELERQSTGGAYMLQRRLERHLREVASSLASAVAADMQHSLEALGIDVVMRPPQNRELSQHEGEMLANAACLVDVAGLERLRRLAAETEERYETLGARVELSGPWPPYNFVPGGDAAALA